MITLELQKGPDWYDLGHGVRVFARPMTTEVRLVAAEVIGPSEDPAATPGQRRQLAWAKAIAAEVVEDWEGIGDVAGEPLPVSVEGLSALLDDMRFYLAFRDEYLNPALLSAAEGNVSAPSPNGSSAEGATTAADAAPAAQSAR